MHFDVIFNCVFYVVSLNSACFIILYICFIFGNIIKHGQGLAENKVTVHSTVTIKFTVSVLLKIEAAKRI